MSLTHNTLAKLVCSTIYTANRPTIRFKLAPLHVTIIYAPILTNSKVLAGVSLQNNMDFTPTTSTYTTGAQAIQLACAFHIHHNIYHGVFVVSCRTPDRSNVSMQKISWMRERVWQDRCNRTPQLMSN